MARRPRRHKLAAPLRACAETLASTARTAELIEEAGGDGYIAILIRQIELARDMALHLAGGRAS